MEAPTRRPSFGGLLKRTLSGANLRKQAQEAREAELERQKSMMPPRLPDLDAEKLTKSFSTTLQLDNPQYHYSENYQMASANGELNRSLTSNSVFSQVRQPPAFDPFARSESMAHRGRYSYASSAVSTLNSPRRVRRRKDPTPFNILVIGTAGAGKTSFIEFLKSALALPARKRANKIAEDEFRVPVPASGNFVPNYLETEIDNERVGLTIWDSEGLNGNMIDLQLREMEAFIESKFEDTFSEERKVVRSPGVQDTHIHTVFLLLDPIRLDRNLEKARKMSANGRQNGFHLPLKNTGAGALDEDIELQVMRTLHQKTTVVPVIAKADTITTKHMRVLKRSVWTAIKAANLDPLEALGMEEEVSTPTGTEMVTQFSTPRRDSDTLSQGPQVTPQASPKESPTSTPSRRLSTQSVLKYKASQEEPEEVPFLPLSIISPDPYDPSVVGREFAWGVADPYNEQHCDFERLKESVFSEWRPELRQASKEQWYEGWRTNKLNRRDRGIYGY